MTADTAGAYAYNGAEQMTTVTQGANTYNYKYAGTSQNEVLQQQKAGTTYQLVYGRNNQQGQPVIEQAQIGSVTAYVFNDPVTGQPLMLRTSTGTVSMYVYTGTGNPIGIITDFAVQSYTYAYDPYGVPVLTSGGSGNGIIQNPYQFAGGIQDRATGWIKCGARWYNPTTGRWTQQDTLDNPLDPANANRYAYAGNDPINNTDPTGRAIGSIVRGIQAAGAFISTGETLSGGDAPALAARFVSGLACYGAAGAGAVFSVGATAIAGALTCEAFSYGIGIAASQTLANGF